MSKELKVWLNVNPHRNRLRAKQYSAAILQKLLKQYHPACDIFDIQIAEKGKPYVENGPYFSYAHCGALHAYVFDNAPIGIDIERFNTKRNTQGIIERHFHEDEWQRYQSVKPELKAAYFFQLWTQKEAWCKQQGGVLWHFLPQSLANCSLNFYSVHSIMGMACCLATEESVSRIDLNVVK